MGIGHIGVGLAAKRVAPKAPLVVLLLASEVVDILCFVFMFAGIEHSSDRLELISIPWSHGLFMSVIWSIAAGTIAFLFFRNRRTSIVIGLVVFSHWVLDFIAHDPDLPLFFNGSPLAGLGLEWSHTATGLIVHWPQALIMEFGLIAAGLVIYIRTIKKKHGLVTAPQK